MRSITIDVLPQKKAKRSASRKWWKRRWVWIPAAIVGCLLLLVIVVGVWRVPPMIASTRAVMDQVEVLKTAGRQQDMGKIKQELPELQQRLDVLHQQVSWFGFVAAWSLVGNYYQDAQHLFSGAEEGITGGQIMVEGVEPYAALLGFKASGEQADKPTEDRIAELTLLMPSLLPSLDKAQVHFERLKQEMDQIAVDKYPGQVGGVDVKGSLTEAKAQVTALEEGIHQARPLLEILPSVLGAPDSRRYLILFQNDKELRPTGGFITSVAYVTFDQGKFTVSDTGDIYTIDKDGAYLPLPTPIRLYLKVPEWHMRDTNFSPDFAESMKDFEYYYQRSGDPPIDGIIALDTQFVEMLMKLTGPLSVAGYAEPFSAEPITVNGTQVPQVVYQLEMIAERTHVNLVDRKGILGDLMQEIIKKALSEPATRWPAYLDMLIAAGQEKHILLNFHDGAAQKLAEERNFAGRIESPETGQDYLHINDANLAGLKSNFYLTQTADRDITVADDGRVTEKLTITYHNTGRFDGWLNATARNYVRVYVPQGAELLSSSGGEQRVTVDEDLGKTVFDNFVTVKPLQKQTITFEYRLPFKMDSSHYSSLIQKQPGANNWNYTTKVNGKSVETLLDGDKTIDIAW